MGYNHFLQTFAQNASPCRNNAFTSLKYYDNFRNVLKAPAENILRNRDASTRPFSKAALYFVRGTYFLYRHQMLRSIFFCSAFNK